MSMFAYDIEFNTPVAIQVNKDAVMQKSCTTTFELTLRDFGVEFRVGGKRHIVPWYNVKCIKEV